MNEELTTSPATTTNETRTCEECSKPYQHEPWFIFENGNDFNADLFTCPSCTTAIHEKEDQERLAIEEEQRRQARENAAKAAWLDIVPELYRETDTEHTDYPTPIHKRAMEWQASRESGDANAKLFLGLIGPSGRCKTRVISQVIKRILWKGQKCQWVNAAEFQRLVQNQWSNDSSYDSCLSSSSTTGGKARIKLRSFRECAVLGLDDLGKGRFTDTVAGALYELIEERSANNRATLWTSNASLDDLIKMLPHDCGGPIVRRLAEFSTIIQL